jgi:hypothetical protein
VSLVPSFSFLFVIGIWNIFCSISVLSNLTMHGPQSNHNLCPIVPVFVQYDDYGHVRVVVSLLFRNYVIKLSEIS